MSHDEEAMADGGSEAQLTPEENDIRNQRPKFEESCFIPMGDIHVKSCPPGLADEKDYKPGGPTSTGLHYSGGALLLVLVNIPVALSSWVTICYLSFRPIATDH